MGQKCVTAGTAASLDEAVPGEGWKKGVKASHHHSPSDTESLQPTEPHTQPPCVGRHIVGVPQLGWVSDPGSGPQHWGLLSPWPHRTRNREDLTQTLHPSPCMAPVDEGNEDQAEV